MNWFQTLRGRLGAKILLAMATAMTVTSLVFLVLIVPGYHDSLLSEHRAGSAKLGRMLQITLENAMLKRDIEGLRTIVERIGQEKDIERVMIVNPTGIVRFSSDPAMIYRHFGGVEGLCPNCQISESGNAFGTTFLTDDQGVKVLRAVNAVANQERCATCHGPVADHPINGYLVIDHSAARLENQAVWSVVLLSGAGFICLLGALGATWLAIRRFVLRPVRALSDASIALAGGDLAARVRFGASGAREADEILLLGQSFDRMADELDKTIIRLSEREVFQQALIDGIPDGIRVINEEFSVVAANKEYCRAVGMTLQEVLAVPCYRSSHGRSERCVPTMVVCPLEALSGSENVQDVVKCSHIQIDHQKDRSYPVEVIASRLEVEIGERSRFYVVESIRDLSRQAKVSQEQRLAEIGQLAVGVAHEIRNPLASVGLGLKAISRSLEGCGQASEIMEYMEAVNTSVAECIVVTDRLLHLSRLPTDKGQLLTVRVVVTDIVELLRYEALSRNVKVEIDIPEQLRIVASDGEMRMVVLNLMQNAFHAMPDGGSLTVRAREKQNGHIEIAFIDTGGGISAEHMTKIFYPFWSWRADGSTGSGLGLPISKATVERWFGEISLSSKLGEGSTFILDFPPADEVIERM